MLAFTSGLGPKYSLLVLEFFHKVLVTRTYQSTRTHYLNKICEYLQVALAQLVDRYPSVPVSSPSVER